MRRIKLQITGTRKREQNAVVEYRFNHGPEWWACTPSGIIHVCDTAAAALREIKKEARRGNKGITITIVEWRDVPDGFRPPQ